MDTRQPPEDFHYLGRPARLILATAFSVLLALLVIAGWSAVSTLSDIHTREQAVRLDFLSRTEPLMQIRRKLVVFGDNKAFTELRSELAKYPQSRQAAEQAMIDRLNTMLTDGDRVGVIDTTEQIAFWNDDQFRTANAGLLASFNELRDRLKKLLLILLGSGLAISLGSIILIAAQEKEIRKRYTELARNRDEQAQLSARLLDAQEQERLSISRELHDEVGQSLGALLVDMGRLSSILPPNDAALHDEMRKIRSLAESSVAAVRNIALLLRPSMLDDLGLVAAIEWQAREISRRSDVEVEVHSEDVPGNIKEETKICVYRITQEALNNVARHSGGHHAQVSLKMNRDAIETTIRDDGNGFDPGRSRGLGILGMEERVRLLHGTFHIESSPGAGTRITACIPIS